MNLTVEEVLILVAAMGLLVLLVWASRLLGAIATFHDWLEKKLEEQRQKKQGTDGGDE